MFANTSYETYDLRHLIIEFGRQSGVVIVTLESLMLLSAIASLIGAFEVIFEDKYRFLLTENLHNVLGFKNILTSFPHQPNLVANNSSALIGQEPNCFLPIDPGGRLREIMIDVRAGCVGHRCAARGYSGIS